MTGREFSAKIRTLSGPKSDKRTIVLDMSGEINTFAEEELNEAYSQVEERSPEIIVLNFTDVSYINSTGIALIVGMLAKARKNRQRMVVYGLSDHYQEIFQITRLADFMDIYPDETSALADTGAIQNT
jgi:anti-anti-sigma factor